MLPHGADRFPGGLGLALWAGFVDGELMYRIIKDYDSEEIRFTYTVGMMTNSGDFSGFLDLPLSAFRLGTLANTVDLAKEAAEDHEASLFNA
jgi:hypothetical protein